MCLYEWVCVCVFTSSPLTPCGPWFPGSPRSPFSPNSPGGPIKPIRPPWPWHTHTHRYNELPSIHSVCVCVCVRRTFSPFLAGSPFSPASPAGPCTRVVRTSVWLHVKDQCMRSVIEPYHRPRGSRLTWGSIQPLFSLRQRENVTFIFIKHSQNGPKERGGGGGGVRNGIIIVPNPC